MSFRTFALSNGNMPRNVVGRHDRERKTKLDQCLLWDAIENDNRKTGCFECRCPALPFDQPSLLYCAFNIFNKIQYFSCVSLIGSTYSFALSLFFLPINPIRFQFSCFCKNKAETNEYGKKQNQSIKKLYFNYRTSHDLLISLQHPYETGFGLCFHSRLSIPFLSIFFLCHCVVLNSLASNNFISQTNKSRNYKIICRWEAVVGGWNMTGRYFLCLFCINSKSQRQHSNYSLVKIILLVVRCFSASSCLCFPSMRV